MVRYKNRYILFELQYQLDSGDISALCKDPAVGDRNSIAHLLENSVQSNFGDHGTACLIGGLAVRYFSPTTGMGIIRVPRDHCAMAWAALSFITSASGRPCVFQVIHLSGSIKQAQRHLIVHNRGVLLHLASAAAEAQVDADKIREAIHKTQAAILAMDS